MSKRKLGVYSYVENAAVERWDWGVCQFCVVGEPLRDSCSCPFEEQTRGERALDCLFACLLAVIVGVDVNVNVNVNVNVGSSGGIVSERAEMGDKRWEMRDETNETTLAGV